MTWYSASICPSDDKLYTLIYCRDYDLLSMLIAALQQAGVTEISERPIEGWCCAYCGAVNKKEVCGGCGAHAPIPMKEQEVGKAVRAFRDKAKYEGKVESKSYPYGTVYPEKKYCKSCVHFRDRWFRTNTWCKKKGIDRAGVAATCSYYEEKV